MLMDKWANSLSEVFSTTGETEMRLHTRAWAVPVHGCVSARLGLVLARNALGAGCTTMVKYGGSACLSLSFAQQRWHVVDCYIRPRQPIVNNAEQNLTKRSLLGHVLPNARQTLAKEQVFAHLHNVHALHSHVRRLAKSQRSDIEFLATADGEKGFSIRHGTVKPYRRHSLQKGAL
jgi:hypothetical protein